MIDVAAVVPRFPLPPTLLARRVVAVIREADESQGERNARRVIEAGLTVVEITLTTPGSVEIMRRLRQSYGSQVTIGVGSVVDPAQVKAAVAAGAEFVVTPASRAAVHVAALESGVPMIAGAMTPTEMLAAWNRPATAALKLFPSSSLGPGYLRDVLAPLPDLPVMPSGGVDGENAAAWFDAGAVAVSIGGSLFRGIRETDGAALHDRVARLIAAARAPVGSS